jgi:hypothetical protein
VGGETVIDSAVVIGTALVLEAGKIEVTPQTSGKLSSLVENSGATMRIQRDPGDGTCAADDQGRRSIGRYVHPPARQRLRANRRCRLVSARLGIGDGRVPCGTGSQRVRRLCHQRQMSRDCRDISEAVRVGSRAGQGVCDGRAGAGSCRRRRALLTGQTCKRCTLGVLTRSSGAPRIGSIRDRG